MFILISVTVLALIFGAILGVASIKLKVKGCEISLDYRKGDDDMYEFIVNGERRQSFYDEDAHTQKIFFTNEELACGKLDVIIR